MPGAESELFCDSCEGSGGGRQARTAAATPSRLRIWGTRGPAVPPGIAAAAAAAKRVLAEGAGRLPCRVPVRRRDSPDARGSWAAGRGGGVSHEGARVVRGQPGPQPISVVFEAEWKETVVSGPGAFTGE